MPFWLTLKLLLIKFALTLGADAALTLRDHAAVLLDGATSPQLRFALITNLVDTGRVYAELLLELAQRF